MDKYQGIPRFIHSHWSKLNIKPGETHPAWKPELKPTYKYNRTKRGGAAMKHTITSLKQEITKKQNEQATYKDEHDIITNSYKFNELMRDISELHTSVEWIEKMIEREVV